VSAQLAPTTAAVRQLVLGGEFVIVLSFLTTAAALVQVLAVPSAHHIALRSDVCVCVCVCVCE